MFARYFGLNGTSPTAPGDQMLLWHNVSRRVEWISVVVYAAIGIVLGHLIFDDTVAQWGFVFLFYLVGCLATERYVVRFPRPTATGGAPAQHDAMAADSPEPAGV